MPGALSMSDETFEELSKRQAALRKLFALDWVGTDRTIYHLIDAVLDLDKRLSAMEIGGPPSKALIALERMIPIGPDSREEEPIKLPNAVIAAAPGIIEQFLAELGGKKDE